MTRVVLENVLLFLLPTLLYVGYVYLTREPGRGATRVMDEAPLIWLFIAGAVLVIVTLVAFGSTSGGKPGQHYEPPVMKDGRIVPGHIE
jgi:hypothetical protein